jgi:beta-glucanase (GH16 family)
MTHGAHRPAHPSQPPRNDDSHGQAQPGPRRPRHRARGLRRLRFRPLFIAPVALAAAVLTTLALVPGDTGTPTSLASANLVVDPDFANGSNAWTTTRGASLQTVPGYNGDRAIAVTNATSGPLTVSLNDRINTVASTVKGTTYRASAWVRVDRPGTSVAVREGAWNNTVSQGQPKLTSSWLRTTDWRYISVDYVAPVSGASIDLNYLAWQLPAGAVFFVSRPTLVAVDSTTPGAPSSSTPPSSPSSAAPSSSSSAPSSAAPTKSPTSSPAPSKSTSSAPAPVAPPPSTSTAPSGSHMVFDDEFNGSSVDQSKWNVRNNSWASNEMSLDTSRPQNVSVGSGVLTITAQRERYTAYGTTRDYTSGYLDTVGLSSHKYGRWEMRAKLPTAQGLWPAFWLRGDHSPAEIDILEAIGGLSQMTVQTVFPDTNDGSQKRSHQHDLPSGNGISNWHVYGFQWSPGSMSWDVDGVTVFKVTSSDASWVGTAFNDSMNIRLNLQVGGSMPAYFNKQVGSQTQLPAEYQVDWVRVWGS